MKIVNFERYVTKREQKLHNELNEVQIVINNTLGDLEINPIITITEVHNALCTINTKFETIIYQEAQELFNNCIAVLEDGIDGVKDVAFDVYATLTKVLLYIEHIKIASSCPVLHTTDEAHTTIVNILSEHPERKKADITLV